MAAFCLSIDLCTNAMNIFQVKGISLGYLFPIVLAAFSGLVLGTNSFVASDLSLYNVRDGMALGLSIETFEMLGYLFIIASTVRYGIYQYDSLWQWKPTTKVMNLRDVRLSTPETLCLVIGILLVIVGAYRETQMAFNLL